MAIGSNLPIKANLSVMSTQASLLFQHQINVSAFPRILCNMILATFLILMYQILVKKKEKKFKRIKIAT